MLVRVRYNPTLALVIAQLASVIEADDFYQLRDVLASEDGPARPADQLLVFDPHPEFASTARRAFRGHIESVATFEQMPLSISCALVSEGDPQALRDWLESIQPSERLRAAVDMFDTWRAAAQWIGLDEMGVEDVRTMRGFKTLYEAPKM